MGAILLQLVLQSFFIQFPSPDNTIKKLVFQKHKHFQHELFIKCVHSEQNTRNMIHI